MVMLVMSRFWAVLLGKTLNGGPSAHARLSTAGQRTVRPTPEIQ